MPYAYVPIVQTEEGALDAAKLADGQLVNAMSDLRGGIRTVHFDEAVPRYVFMLPEDHAILDGWEVKTSAEIAADYPDLQGV